MFRTRKDKGKAGKRFKGRGPQLNVGLSVELVLFTILLACIHAYSFGSGNRPKIGQFLQFYVTK